ncbi:hypothetical protein NQZ68_033463, partial [Dissostichus eleginoides]
TGLELPAPKILDPLTTQTEFLDLNISTIVLVLMSRLFVWICGESQTLVTFYGNKGPET